MNDTAKWSQNMTLHSMFIAMEKGIAPEDEMIVLIRDRIREATLEEIATVPVEMLRRWASRLGVSYAL